MISPSNLRQAIRRYLYVEFNADQDFAYDLAAGDEMLDHRLKVGLARILASQEMDFDDFTALTDNYTMSDDEIIERLRRIWDTAFPDVEPSEFLQRSEGH